MNAAAQATDQVAAHESVVKKTSKNAVDSDSTTRMMAAIEAAIERAISMLTAAGATIQVAGGIAWEAAKEAVDGNPRKVIDKTLLDDLRGWGILSRMSRKITGVMVEILNPSFRSSSS